MFGFCVLIYLCFYMRFQDITNDTTTTYRLTANEQVVFFMLNRSGDMTFELAGEKAAAHVFAFFLGKHDEKATLNISQKHLARETTSRVLVKSVLFDQSQFSYRGTLHIAQNASLADASQENRNLLLSSEAKAISEPILEILNNDVRCHHAVTTSPLNAEQLFFAQTRGLSAKQAEILLIRGFLHSSLTAMGTLISSQDQEKVLALMKAETE